MNATEFVELVENTLGWDPGVTPDRPHWKALMGEAAKVNRKIKTNPTLYSWDNLVVTVAWLRRHKRSLSPLGVIAAVEDALKAAGPAEAVSSDLSGQIHLALTTAFLEGDTDWVERLARATGPARLDVLMRWEASRG